MKNTKKRAYRSTGLLVMASILLIWAVAYPIAAQFPETVFKEPFNTTYDVLNVLFTALAFGGVIVTLIFQADQASSAEKESKERSILELFQVFTSQDFKKTKDAAFRVLIPAIRHKPYAEYVASRLFAIAQLPLPIDAAIQNTIIGLDRGGEVINLDNLKEIERADRLKLDDVFNFFAMLAQRESASDIVKHVDFAYDWWRPALMLIAQTQLEHRSRHPEIAIYCRNRPVMETLTKLDDVFGHDALTSDQQIWEYLANHPKMISFEIDPAFTSRP